MKIQSFLYTSKDGWYPQLNLVNENVDFVLSFGSEDIMFNEDGYNTLRRAFPHAQIVGCTAAAEIHGDEIYEGSITVTAIDFASSHVEVVTRHIDKESDSKKIGKELALELMEQEKLKHIFVLAEGVLTNGLKLVQGLNAVLPKTIAATGGLACNHQRLDDTRLWHNDSGPQHQVIAVGFYGDNITAGYGSFGGWESFGPKRKVTRSDGNIVYELDGQPALDLYKKYLGEEAKNLPISSMKFPLIINDSFKEQSGYIRGVNNVNEAENALIFAGDIDEGVYVKLMCTNIDSLVNSGFEAAKAANEIQNSELAIMISCIGRKALMERRTVEEVEDASEVLGDDCVVTGFYSFGELCPQTYGTECLLQNQTMTITTLKEVI